MRKFLGFLLFLIISLPVFNACVDSGKRNDAKKASDFQEVKTWGGRFFSLNVPSDWTSPETDYLKSPMKEKDDILFYKDACFSPGEETGVMEVEIFEDKNGKPLNYKKFIRSMELVLSDSSLIVNGLPTVRREGIVQVHDGAILKDHFETVWCIQGQKRVYRLNYGSYNKYNYDKYIGVAETIVSGFKEKY